jgi:hypothetical protein
VPGLGPWPLLEIPSEMYLKFTKVYLKYSFLDAQEVTGMGSWPKLEISSEMSLKFPKQYFKIFIFRRSRSDGHGAMAYIRNTK